MVSHRSSKQHASYRRLRDPNFRPSIGELLRDEGEGSSCTSAHPPTVHRRLAVRRQAFRIAYLLKSNGTMLDSSQIGIFTPKAHSKSSARNPAVARGWSRARRCRASDLVSGHGRRRGSDGACRAGSPPCWLRSSSARPDYRAGYTGHRTAAPAGAAAQQRAPAAGPVRQPCHPHADLRQRELLVALLAEQEPAVIRLLTEVTGSAHDRSLYLPDPRGSTGARAVFEPACVLPAESPLTCSNSTRLRRTMS